MPPAPHLFEVSIDLKDPVSQASTWEGPGHLPQPNIRRCGSRNALNALEKRNSRNFTVPVTSENALRPLHCALQQYAWGRIGTNSMAARMKAAQSEQYAVEGEERFTVDDTTPYAELWLGSHPSGMCKVTVDDKKNDGTPETNNNATRTTTTLKEYVQSNPELHLGTKTQNDLTYLFKVLSIEKVLSIQSHPDKRLAERLNRERPDDYKDANHKPEMAVALSKEVQAMCGFRPLRELSSNLKAYPELAVLVGDEYTHEIHQLVDSPGIRTVLRNMFRTYLERSPEEVQGQLNILLPRLKAMDSLDEIQELIIRLSEQFPGDSGVMAPLIFNVLVMTEGQAFFINANEPHAYISGEILECMACSDNVVRAGLTPKLKDVDTLVSMLTYKAFYPDVVGGHKIDDCLVRYEPPVSDFCIEIITVPAGETYEVHDVRSGAVFLTLSGSGTLLQGDVTEMSISFGSSAFGSANTKTMVVAGPDGVRIARAMSNVYHGNYLWQGGSWEMNEYMFDEFE